MSAGDKLILLVAQGFGAGRARKAPGTFGSLAGIPWLLLCAATGSTAGFYALACLGVVVSIWAAGRAEKLLGQTDPGSVVIDEIIAIPFCFIANLDLLLPLEHALKTTRTWLFIGLAFAFFRLFDIWKPWPIRSLQRLPGGLGVTVDDIAAGLATAAVLYLLSH